MAAFRCRQRGTKCQFRRRRPTVRFFPDRMTASGKQKWARERREVVDGRLSAFLTPEPERTTGSRKQKIPVGRLQVARCCRTAFYQINDLPGAVPMP